MIDSNTLKHVAEMAKVADRYISASGEDAYVSEDTICHLLGSLGYDTSSAANLLKSAEKKHKKDVLKSVMVKRADQPIEIELYLGVSARDSDFSWRLETEAGDIFEGYLQSQVVRDERSTGGPLVFALPKDLPWGYHRLSLIRKRRKSPYLSTLIITPSACYQQPQMQSGKKMWGPSVQLYTLRTGHNWGIGDFGDLKQLVGEVASRGGDFVGLNPIHALFPANPEAASPYSPSSRRWLNVLYIDVSSVPEFSLCSEAQQQVGSADFQQRLQQARESHWVNYQEVASLKLAILPLLFQEFKTRHLETNSERAQAFLAFVESGAGSLLQQAAFDALHADFYAKDNSVWGWPVFPEQYQHFSNRAVQQYIREHQEQVQYYLYLQWIAEEQVKEVQDLADEKGMSVGLYRDLAVGVADSGVETWADNGCLVQDASIGAPPDILGPLGQNWGLPPLSPQKLQATGYDAFIQLLRANMKHCGALRIDHVLGLLRLWWIPKGGQATQGAYVYYPVEEMLAILALESHRHHCSVIGEDLGTVPEEIVELLREAGIYSYKVFFFETSRQDGGYLSPSHYASQSMATLCTHDMPTLRGFWHCDDLKMGHELGLYPDEQQLQTLFNDRLKSKQGILDSVAWHGRLPEGVGQDANFVPMDESLSEALQYHVAAGSSALLSVQLEDWLHMDNPVNIPGTVDEYPNWRRKLSMDLDRLFSEANVNRVAANLTEARAKASQR
ncbi:4-alpha-glucanotransferase [Vibrio renipiscarius]|uniref:4-alpha-glucanotransferase n=1 Tax=Vibrio renipiscarius TaxID=1461322 RepID=A0A0C2JEF0_9VIBR|nr:4-alpha-glucanotransferase [Vibrio renipiscarius]KII76319.1 4-alpha-glucanotransferase [Vibrio renipiscarius]KII78158.1 4-alpha-glucanotransferase [Vibrio renipiscarius]